VAELEQDPEDVMSAYNFSASSRQRKCGNSILVMSMARVGRKLAHLLELRLSSR
jgi:hypothetical protein